MNNKARGNARELKARDLLVAGGCYVQKGGGSLGCADLVALLRGTRPKMIQVKGTKAGPFSDFGPEARAELLKAAHDAGADAELWHWPAGKPLRIYLPSEWPNTVCMRRVAKPCPSATTCCEHGCMGDNPARLGLSA